MRAVSGWMCPLRVAQTLQSSDTHHSVHQLNSSQALEVTSHFTLSEQMGSLSFCLPIQTLKEGKEVLLYLYILNTNLFSYSLLVVAHALQRVYVLILWLFCLKGFCGIMGLLFRKGLDIGRPRSKDSVQWSPNLHIMHP